MRGSPSTAVVRRARCVVTPSRSIAGPWLTPVVFVMRTYQEVVVSGLVRLSVTPVELPVV